MSINLTSIATAAAQFLGVLDSGESLSSQQLTDALNATNDLLDNWSSEQTMIPALLRSVQTLTSAVQLYTIGTGQTWNMARPVAIVAAQMTNPSGPGSPIEIVNAGKWASLPDRQRLSWLVTHLFYDRGNPNGNVLVSPVPQGAGLSVEIESWVPLTQFADLTTPITLPPGYQRPLKIAVAVELAPQFSVPISKELAQMYQDALARIRNLNAELVGTEPAAGQVDASSTPAGSIRPNQAAQ